MTSGEPSERAGVTADGSAKPGLLTLRPRRRSLYSQSTYAYHKPARIYTCLWDLCIPLHTSIYICLWLYSTKGKMGCERRFVIPFVSSGSKF